MIDTGVVLDNINIPFVTDGKPDCGALEVGQPLPNYGYQGPFLPTGIYENADENDRLSIYPNPTTGICKIQIENGQLSIDNYQLSIYNALGECIHRQINKSTNQQIDLSSLPAGMYTCIVRANDSTFRKKIVIAK